MKHTRMTWLAIGAVVASLSFMQCGGGGGSDAGTGGGTGGGAMGGGSGGGTGGGTGGGAGGGTGGGTGGGAGGGTGGGTGCTQVSFPPASYQAANYVPQNGQNPPWNWAIFAIPSQTASRLDVFGVELWFFGGSANPTYPYNVTLAATDYGSCEVCLTYQEACDNTGANCSNFFLAQSGSVTFTQATKATPGVFKGSGSNIRFVEWDETNDVAKPNGRCVELASYTMDAYWPAMSTDAGMDDAGTSDAGMTDGGADGG